LGAVSYNNNKEAVAHWMHLTHARFGSMKTTIMIKLEQIMKIISIFLGTLLMACLATMASAGERDEGITCVSKGSYKTAVYDKGSNGQVISTRIKVGNSYKGGKCMGRCGGACGGWAPSAWTKDCLDHDICIVDQDGKNGLAWDKNCGDEFNHAADDYTFGVLRGCRG